MLKLTYTDNSFYLERLGQSLEIWVTTRVTLALRTATTLNIEPSTACFLLPADLSSLADLEELIDNENTEVLALAIVDRDCLEVSLNGTWLGSAAEAEHGIFVTVMGDRTELLLEKIWQEAQAVATVKND